jgi:hypothetical protein
MGIARSNTGCIELLVEAETGTSRDGGLMVDRDDVPVLLFWTD